MLIKKQIVTITQSGVKQLNSIIKSYECNAVLFSVKGGGCNGFNYDLKPTFQDKHAAEEFITLPQHGYKLFVCNKSLMHVIGTEIDWKKTIMGEAFHFNNPMAASNCGCGTSFASSAFD